VDARLLELKEALEQLSDAEAKVLALTSGHVVRKKGGRPRKEQQSEEIQELPNPLG
jgi:hypothetical protein